MPLSGLGMRGAEEGKAMRAALRSIVGGFLRERGFRGSFPHLQRLRNSGVEVVSFMFAPVVGGRFTVELGVGPQPGEGERLLALRAWGCGGRRERLRPGDDVADHWFVHGRDEAEFLREFIRLTAGQYDWDQNRRFTFASSYEGVGRFEELAGRVVVLFEERGDVLFDRLAVGGR